MKPVVLMILDGWGISGEEKGNAILGANTPNFDKYINTYAHATLSASGEDVGLPCEQQGNSEVGHLNLGAGRVVYQELTKINKAIREKTFFNNLAFLDVMQYCKKEDKALHLMGLVSPGGVHSHSNHLLALVQMAKDNGLTKVYIDAFLDGRDVSPKSALEYISELNDNLANIGVGEIASIGGRYFAMDRDNRWDRVEKGYKAIIGEGNKATDVLEVIKASYDADVFDEFVEPTTIVDDNGSAIGALKKNDGVIFFNYRADRAREISRSIAQSDFNEFERGDFLEPKFVAMCLYSDEFVNFMQIAYPPEDMKNTLGEVIAKNNLKQVRIAETEKFAHVTSFFNGSVVEPNVNEDRVLVPSPKVATYDLAPQMSANEVKTKVLDAIDSDEYDFILVNFANCDMVGHTGIYDVAKVAVETVDSCVGEIVEKVKSKNGAIIITADHGNAEKMIDENGGAFTAHTANLVPVIVISDGINNVKNGSLCDIAPTVLALLNINKPVEMTGNSLIN